MRENRVKRIMRDGRVALIGYAGPFEGATIIELLGHAGYDGVRIDLEHSAFDLADIQLKILAAERMGITPIVRVPSLDPAFILRILDMGAQGISVPGVGSVEDARAVVDAVRYPPLGSRGVGNTTRATDYGLVPMREHLEQSNREILLLVLLEEVGAINDVEAITSVDGIDVIAIGPSDLGTALGVAGQPNHPDLVAAIERIAAIVRKKEGLHLSISVKHKMFPRSFAELRKLGVRYSNVGPHPEVRLLDAMRSQMAELRAELESS